MLNALKETFRNQPPFVFTSFEEIFGNAHPVEVEMGCGKGKFLLLAAAAHPEINFLGVDIAQKWMKVGRERGEKRQLGNVRFIKADSREVLEQFPAASVSVFHLYFPDPWPKRRHRRRRIVNEVLVRHIGRSLKAGGHLEIATDDQDYFQAIRKVVLSSDLRWSAVREAMNERIHRPLYKTNYELKFEAADRPLYYLEVRK